MSDDEKGVGWCDRGAVDGKNVPLNVQNAKAEMANEGAGLRRFSLSKNRWTAIVHILTAISLTHLAWVAFVMRSSVNPVPSEIEITALLFSFSYLFVIVTWLADIRFMQFVHVNSTTVKDVNQALFGGFGYISPFREATKASDLTVGRGAPLFDFLSANYYRDIIVVFFLLFFYGSYRLIFTPAYAIEHFKIVNSDFGLFAIALALFYGAGATLLALALRGICWISRVVSNFK